MYMCAIHACMCAYVSQHACVDSYIYVLYIYVFIHACVHISIHRKVSSYMVTKNYAAIDVAMQLLCI